MKQVTLGELLRCEREYQKVDTVKLKDPEGWAKGWAALKAAISHARQGTTVYVTNNVGVLVSNHGDYYLLAGSDELVATVCSNHLGKRVAPAKL